MDIATVSAYMNSFVDEAVSIQLIWLVPMAIGVLGGVAVVRFIIRSTFDLTMRI